MALGRSCLKDNVATLLWLREVKAKRIVWRNHVCPPYCEFAKRKLILLFEGYMCPTLLWLREEKIMFVVWRIYSNLLWLREDKAKCVNLKDTCSQLTVTSRRESLNELFEGYYYVPTLLWIREEKAKFVVWRIICPIYCDFGKRKPSLLFEG